jgi:hypothetical protein
LLDPCKPREIPSEHRRQSDQNQSRNKARIEESNRNKFNFGNNNYLSALTMHGIHIASSGVEKLGPGLVMFAEFCPRIERCQNSLVLSL